MPPVPTVLPAATVSLSGAVQAAVAQAGHYANAAAAANTKRAYTSDWADWTAWCVTAATMPLPASPAAVGAYLADRVGRLAVATVARRLAAISTAHRQAGLHLDTRHPAIRDVLRGIRRQHGSAPKQARPTTTPILLALAATCDDSLLGQRDRALLLVGFTSALRRSELAALDITDMAFCTEGVRLHVRRSKTDGEGAGQVIGVSATGTATCPVTALRAWLEAAMIRHGKVFRSLTRHGRIGDSLTGEAVAMVVQRRATLAGLDPTDFSAHSLRAGLATSAAAAGVAEGDIQRQTRHRSIAVLRGYVRHGSVFIRNASAAIGL